MLGTKTVEKWFNEGRQARLEGKPISANPYWPAGEAHAHWLEAWRNADNPDYAEKG